MKRILLLFLFAAPALLYAQEFVFQPEYDSIPAQMNGWDLFCPWVGGFTKTTPALADVDNDGDLDLFFGEYTGKIAFALNTGTALLADFTWVGCPYDSLHTISSGLQSDVDFADLDGDNDLDAIIGSGAVTYVENMGSSSAPAFVAVPETLKTNSGSLILGPTVALADIDADGDMDLIAGYTTYLILYLNEGNAGYYSFAQQPYPWLGISVGDGGWANPTFADIDSDGDLDLFVGTYYGKIYFYRNDGTPQTCNFTLVSNFYGSIDVGNKASPEFADIDGDNDLDLFVGEEFNGDMHFFENIGSTYDARFQLITLNYLTIDIGDWGDPNFCAQLVDIDADDDLDILTGATSSIYFFANQDSGSGPAFQLMTNNWQNISVPWPQPTFGDLDDDGDYDLICGEGVIPGPPNIWLFINQGTPTQPDLQVYSPTYITNPEFHALTIPVLADIDSDGDLDLFVQDGLYNFYFYENIGGPSAPDFVLVTSQWQGIIHEMSGFCFGDLDGDSDLDLLTSTPEEDNLYYYLNQGDSTSANMVLETESFLSEPVQYIYAPSLSDFDQDGDLDLFIGDEGAGLYLYRNITGQVSVPPVIKHPDAGLHLSLGPNPANPNTVITFTLPYTQAVDLAVYNLLGARITTLASGFTPAGTHRINWADATGTASGTYLVRLSTEQDAITQKITIIK